MKRIGVLVENSYEDLELWYPLLRLREAGFEAITIGPDEGKIYNSKHGYPCKADKSIADVKAEDLDGLIIPGGWCPDYLRRDRRFVHLVAEVAKSGRLVGSICHGPWLLCSARCIAGRRVTCFVAIRDDVENAGAKYEDLPVVVDGNLVTSRTPSDLNHFMKAVLEVLSKHS